MNWPIAFCFRFTYRKVIYVKVNVFYFLAQRVPSGVTNIRLQPTATMFSVGQTVRCAADGFPPARYRWIQLPENVEVSANDTLQLSHSAASQSYMCVASNFVDGNETSIYSQHVYFKSGSKPPSSCS